MTPDQAIDTVARNMIVALWERETDVGGPFWEDYPELSEADFAAAVARARELTRRMEPEAPLYQQAYWQLADRAGKEAS